MKRTTKLVALTAIAAASFATSAYAYSVVDKYDHGSTVQVELKCNSGSKARVTYYKNTGKYCTAAMSCSTSMDKAARWACSE